MKNFNDRASGLFLTLLVMTFMVACASQPVKFDLPANHPAHSEAQEAEFAPPPNPFQQDLSAVQEESAPEPVMKSKMHQKSSQQQMDHHRGTDKGAESDSAATQKHRRTDDHQHKGPGQ